MKAWQFLILLSLLFASACAPAKWISLGTPPSGATRVSPLDGVEGVWVETKDGEFFSTLLSSACDAPTPCSTWTRLAEEPPEPSPWPAPERGPDCSSLNARHRVADAPGTVIECIYVTVQAADTNWFSYYAVMSDGSVMHLDDNGPLAGLWIFTSP